MNDSDARRWAARDAGERLLDRHVVLIGFMGAGKSSLGAPLAEALSRPFFDSDEAIQASTGQTVNHLFAAIGEAEFRAIEASTIEMLLDHPAAVVALGGGAMETDVTRSLVLESCFVVHLHVSWADVEAALPALSVDRPLLQQPHAEIHALYVQRQETYRQAHLHVHLRRGEVDAAVEHILAALRGSTNRHSAS
jgi:shikimate kinase